MWWERTGAGVRVGLLKSKKLDRETAARARNNVNLE